jgi:hypothetical protein
MGQTQSRPNLRNVRLSADWVSLIVALGLTALVRLGVFGAIPW